MADAGELNYKLIVGLYLENKAASGAKSFAKELEGVEKQAASAQKRADELKRSLQAIQSGNNGNLNYASRNMAQERIVQLARQEIELRKKLVDTSSSEERIRIESEIKALGLIKQEVGVRKQELAIKDKLLKDSFADQQRAAKAEQDAAKSVENEAKAQAELRMRNEKELAAQVYREQQQREQRDLAQIKLISEAKKRADAENAQYRARVQNQRSAEIEARLSGILASRSAAYDARRAQFSELRGSLNMAGGIAAGVASRFMLGGLGEGMRSGADMQSAMTTTQIATAGSAAQMEDFRSLAFQIADKTAQSATDAMKNIAILAGSGLNDPKQLRELAAPIAKFADVQYLKNHTSFEESAKQGVQIAHLFGAYTPEKINPILEKLTQVSFAMPDNLNRFLTQAGYYEPVFKGLGVSDAESLEAGAIIDRAGLGRGKGGTALQNLLLNEMNGMALTKHVQGARRDALYTLGLTNKDGSSKFYNWNSKDNKNEFHVVDALKQINKAVHDIPKGLTGKEATKWQAQRIMAVNSALGLTGERAALAITPEAISNLDDALKRISQSGNMSEIQGKYMGTLSAQEARFKSNMDSLLTDLMWPWINQLRGGFQWMGDEAHALQSWVHQHREAAKMVSFAIAAIGSGLAVYSGATMWGAIAGLSSLTRAIQLLGTQSVVAGGEVAGAEAAIGVSSAAIAAAAAAVAVGTAAVYYAVHHFDPRPDDHHGTLGGQQSIPSSVEAIAQGIIKNRHSGQKRHTGDWSDAVLDFLHVPTPIQRHNSGRLIDPGAGSQHFHGPISIEIKDSHDPHKTAHAVAMMLRNAGNTVQKYGAVPSSPFVPSAQSGTIGGAYG